jgi:hypothetical protein
VAAQERLPSINSDQVSFVGAWTLYGFHEDGFTSGIRAAERLGAKIPFEIIDARYIRGKRVHARDSKRSRWDMFCRMMLNTLQWIIMALTGILNAKEKLD